MEKMDELQAIIIKHLRQETLSEEEAAMVGLFLQGRGKEFVKKFEDKDWVREQLMRLREMPDQAVKERIHAQLEAEGVLAATSGAAKPAPVVTMARRSFWRVGIAAAVVVLLFATGIFYWKMRTDEPKQPFSAGQAIVAVSGMPGGDRAVLTLSDGRQIDLDSSGNGAVADQGNVKISKLASGQLAYNVSTEKPGTAAYNILTTPRAGQFTLRLPDGTKVWLNNASSLRYPVYFSGGSREVELSGEGFFEVAKDPGKPFIVQIRKSAAGMDGGSVEVMGTSFNIMAYSDEHVQRTTLVEGKVQFVRQGHQQILQPEEQSVVDSLGRDQLIPHVNVQEVTAWKNGYFHFDHSDLRGTMRQLARWYDVDVEYKGQPGEHVFMGKIPRSLPLPAVLKGLEDEHLHFKLEGRVLSVLP
jgi:ferric-dicitrate binding protein FerR (iron transport regulator)